MLWALFIQAGIPVAFVLLGYTVGTLVERAHFKRLERQERELNHIVVSDVRTYPRPDRAASFGLVTGEVVIASDYFKTFAAAIRKLVGGELYSFESLMERARREALVRLKKSAASMGATHVVNVRFSTSNVGSLRRRGAAMVEMYAYGTAVRAAEPAAS